MAGREEIERSEVSLELVLAYLRYQDRSVGRNARENLPSAGIR